MKTDEPSVPMYSGEKQLQRFLFWSCVVVIVLHAYGSFFPVATTWGFHHLGFFPQAVSLVALLLMVFCLTKAGQAFIVTILERISTITSRPALSTAMFSLLLVFCAALFWFGRERIFFLGDGNLIVRTLPNISVLKEVAIAYRNEPFAGWLVWKLYHLLTLLELPSAAERSFQILSIFFGLASVAALVQLLRQFTNAQFERIAAGLLILGSGTTQLFFGYVELYAPAIFGVLLYFVMALRFLKGKTPLLYPALAFGVLTTFHLGMLSLAPSLAYLLYRELKLRRSRNVIVACLASFALFAGLIALSGYTPATFWENLTSDEKVHFLGLATSSSVWHTYTLFSPWHIVDFLNLNLLVAPFTLILLAVLLVSPWRVQRGNVFERLFLLIASVCGLGFSFAVNADLGMSRDWDLLSGFIFPSVLFSTFLWLKKSEQVPGLKTTTAMMIGVTLLHTGFWVALNADKEYGFARFQTLQDERLWSRGALGNAYEELAIYYRNQQDYSRAEIFFEKYLALDSTNSRIWVSLANVHKATKNIDGEIRGREKALLHGWRREDAYADLGKLYISQRRYSESSKLTKEGLGVFPHSGKLLNNMGVTLAQQQMNCAEALDYFLKAIAKDSTVAEAFLNAGLCYQLTNETMKMRLYWEKFLLLAPDAPQAPLVKDILTRKR